MASNNINDYNGMFGNEYDNYDDNNIGGRR